MGILQLMERGADIRKAVDGPLISAPMSGERASPVSTKTDLLQAYRISTGVYGAVRAIAFAVAAVPIFAVRTEQGKGTSLHKFKRTEGIRRWEDVRGAYLDKTQGEIVESHWLLDLIDNPLPKAEITRHELLQAIVTYLELHGNSYVEKLFASERKTRPIGLWPKIDPNKMSVIPDEEEFVKGYFFQKSTTVKVFSADEIIHFLYFHPESPYYGLSPTEVVRQSLVGDLRAVDWNRAFFERGAWLSGVLESDQRLSQRDIDLYADMFNERNQGVANAGITGVFGQGLKYKTITPTHTDMGFLELRKFVLQEISRVYGVPLSWLGERTGINRATAQMEDKHCYENTILPRIDKIEAQLNFDLVPKGEKIRLMFAVDEIDALQEDIEAKARTGQRLIVQGWTPNEVRSEYWSKPKMISGGDDVYLPGNLMAIGGVEAEKGKSKEKVVKTAEEDAAKLLPSVDPGLEAQSGVHLKNLPLVGMAGAERGVAVIGDMVDIPADWVETWGIEPAVQTWVEQRTAAQVVGIDNETRRRITGVIGRGLDEAKGTAEIGRDIRREFEDMSRIRADTIARTEIHNALGEGSRVVYVNAGIGKHEWVSALDDRCREAHVAANGQRKAIDEPFNVMGELIMRPGEGSAANSIGCRCVEAPFMEGISRDYEAFWKDWDATLTKVEGGKTGKAYLKDLGAFFIGEGKRYEKFFLEASK